MCGCTSTHGSSDSYPQSTMVLGYRFESGILEVRDVWASLMLNRTKRSLEVEVGRAKVA